MPTVGSLFAGCGGTTLGAIAAGFEPIWANDYDFDIGMLYYKNIGRIDGRDFLNLKPSQYIPPDLLVASPPCVHFSGAKHNNGETKEDVALATKLVEFIEYMTPKYLFIENVSKYLQSESLKIIRTKIAKLGYSSLTQVYDVSYFGVPQTRKRMVLLASKLATDLSILPPAPADRRANWYDAIKDLLPYLAETTLTDWQVRSLEKHQIDLPAIALIQKSGSRDKIQVKLTTEPSFTIRSMSGNIRPNCNQAVVKYGDRILKLDARCYARLQTFSDSFVWSPNLTLNVRAIGNAVPPLFAEIFIRSLINV